MSERNQAQKKGNGRDRRSARLAEAHLVGKDAVDAVLEEGDKPRHAHSLVVPADAHLGRSGGTLTSAQMMAGGSEGSPIPPSSPTSSPTFHYHLPTLVRPELGPNRSSGGLILVI